jgi:hypothetical protein
MVDFRYHVVSIVAVFLALATGILFGTTQLNGPVLDNLESQVDTLRAEKNELRDFRDDLEATLKQDDEFLRAVAPGLVGGRLNKRSVVVVSAPQVDNDVRDEVLLSLREAGATLTGDVRVQSRFGDPKAAGELDDLVTRLVPAGVDIAKPTTAERVAALLAAVLVTERSGAPLSTASASAVSVVAGLEGAGVIDVEGGRTPVQAELVVVLLAPPDRDLDDEEKQRLDATNSALLALVDALAKGSNASLAASPREGAGDGSALGALRSDSTRKARTATVDYVDTPAGRVAAVLALAEALEGETGHYGSGSDVDALVPDLVAQS